MPLRSLNLKTAFLTVSVLAILVLTVSGCSTSSGDDDDARGSERIVETNRGGDDGSSDPDLLSGDSDSASEAEAPEAADADSFDAAIQTNYVANQAPVDRLIIRTVTVSLTVEDVSQATNWVRDLASRKSGFVFSSNTYVRDESEFAQVTIRVPADQLDSTVQELREHDLVIQVDSEESTSQDVSQEYVDNEARLDALEETQRRFLALLSEADTVEDILRIESELTDIRSQIETIKGRQGYLDQMTSFSTVTITMHVENEEIETEEEDGEGFIARLFGDSWDDASGFIEGMLTAVITLGIVGLAVLPVAVPVYFLSRLGYRRVRNALNDERNAQPAATTSGDIK